MSTANEPTGRMLTRGGAKDKMARLVKQFKSGSIDKEDKVEVTQPSTQTQKTATVTKAAKEKPSKKAKKKEGPKTTKQSSTSKEVDVAAMRALASKLAELDDKQLKQSEAACSLHPRYWKDEVPGKYML